MSNFYYNPELDEVRSSSVLLSTYGLIITELNAKELGWFPYLTDRDMTLATNDMYEIVATVKSGNSYIGRTAIKQDQVDILSSALIKEAANTYDQLFSDIRNYIRKDLPTWDAGTEYQVDNCVLSPNPGNPEVITVWRCTQTNTGTFPDYDIDEWTTTMI